MKLLEIVVSRSARVNTALYEHKDAFVSSKFEIEPGDDIANAYAYAWLTVQREIQNQERTIRNGDKPMPIKAIRQAVTPSFPEIGRLYKGAPKTDPKRPGKDLTYFRAKFGDTQLDQQTAAEFEQLFGSEPREIPALFQADEIDLVFDTWFEKWKGGARGECIHRCDGETIVYPPDLRGQPCTLQGDKDHKPVGRLRFMVPGVKRAGHFVLVTHSFYDIRNIYEQLEAAVGLFRGLLNVPFVIMRKPRNIKTPGGVFEKWLISIEVAGWFINQQLEAMHKEELVIESPELLGLPPGATVDEETGEILDGDYEPTPGPPPAPPARTTKAPTTQAARAEENQDEADQEALDYQDEREGLQRPEWWNAPAYKQKKKTGKTNGEEFLTKAGDLGVPSEDALALAASAAAAGWTVAGAFRKLKALADQLGEIPEDEPQAGRPQAVAHDWNVRHQLTAQLAADYNYPSHVAVIDALNQAHKDGAFEGLDISDDDIVMEAFAAVKVQADD